DADLEARVAHRAHDVAAAPADVGSGKQGAVEQGPQAVVGDDRGARYLGEKPAAERALDRPAGVIRADAEQKGRARAVFLEHVDQARHPLAGAVVGIDVDLEGELHSTSPHSTRPAASWICVR